MRESEDAEGDECVVELELAERQSETSCESRDCAQIIAADFVLITSSEM